MATQANARENEKAGVLSARSRSLGSQPPSQKNSLEGPRSLSTSSSKSLSVPPKSVLPKNESAVVAPPSDLSSGESKASLPGELMATAKEPASPPKEGSSFHRRFGIGFTLIPASGVFYVFTNITFNFYYGGFQAELLGRLHPRITLQFSPGFYITTAEAHTGEPWKEFSFPLGIRVHLRALPALIPPRFFLPYVSLGLQNSLLFGETGEQYPELGIKTVYVAHPSLKLGGYLGVGFELEVTPRFAVHAELRSFGQGTIDIYNHGLRPGRAGLQLHLGVAGYF